LKTIGLYTKDGQNQEDTASWRRSREFVFVRWTAECGVVKD